MDVSFRSRVVAAGELLDRLLVAAGHAAFEVVGPELEDDFQLSSAAL